MLVTCNSLQYMAQPHVVQFCYMRKLLILLIFRCSVIPYSMFYSVPFCTYSVTSMPILNYSVLCMPTLYTCGLSALLKWLVYSYAYLSIQFTIATCIGYYGYPIVQYGNLVSPQCCLVFYIHIATQSTICQPILQSLCTAYLASLYHSLLCLLTAVYLVWTCHLVAKFQQHNI